MTEESVSEEIPDDVRANVESVEVTLTDKSLGRINGIKNNGWFDDSVIDTVQTS